MPKRILIVDDDPDVRSITRRFLESRTKCEICGEAINGADAIDKAATLNPDLILMDYSMPLMNGIQAGAVLKNILPEVTIILYTGNASEAIECAAMSAGIWAVVPKPDMDKLAEHLKVLLD